MIDNNKKYLSREEFDKFMNLKKIEYKKYQNLKKYEEVIEKVFEKQLKNYDNGIIKPYINLQTEIIFVEIVKDLSKENLEQLKKEINFIVKIEKAIKNL